MKTEEKNKIESYKVGGLEKRYQIRKLVYLTDGQIRTKATDPNADYFVMRLDKDPHALKALMAYSESVRKDNPTFANDILDKLEEYDFKATHQEGRECYVEIKPEDELPPTHQVVIGIYDDSTAISYVWFNKEDSIWRYSLEGGGNVHAPEPESWLKKKAPPTNESKQER